MKTAIFLLLATSLLLSACATAEQRAANLANREIECCKEAGFKQGTDAFANCRLQVRLKREQQADANFNSAMDDLSNSMRGMSPPPTTTHCNSFVGLGGKQVTTSCY